MTDYYVSPRVDTYTPPVNVNALPLYDSPNTNNDYDRWLPKPFDLSPNTNLENYEVMLRYIIEKNGGTVTVNQHSFFGIPYGLKSITVTLNGITKTYTNNDYRIVQRRAIISADTLIYDFYGFDDYYGDPNTYKYYLEKFTHSKDDKFEREIDAVIAFGLMFHERSLYEQQEYGARIDKNTDGTFSFTGVQNSQMQNHGNMNKVDITPRKNSVAIIHTHWKSEEDGGSLMFSGGDFETFDEGAEHWASVSKYLVNRDGTVYKAGFNKSSEKHFNPTKPEFSIK